MLTTLGSNLFYNKLKKISICHVHYIPFTCGRGLLKFWDFETYFDFIRNSNFITFKLWTSFWIWVVGYYYQKHLPSL
jgi:hypothetical protein